MDNAEKFIHLLYVPTMNCNMSCKYCYLGDKTSDSKSERGCVETLEYAVEKLLNAGVMPFNISLHGGEVTCLSKQDFRDTAAFIADYYDKHRAVLEQNGFQVGRPHIKTNLFGLDRHIDSIRELNISVSGSLDLPFSLHDEFRVTKDGKSTLAKILENIELLRGIPNRKKVSATIFKEHFDRLFSSYKSMKQKMKCFPTFCLTRSRLSSPKNQRQMARFPRKRSSRLQAVRWVSGDLDLFSKINFYSVL